MITRETDYAIRTLLYLVRKGTEAIVSTKHLSEEMQIPYRFLRKIVHRLSESGFIESKKGNRGGIRLLKEPAAISVYDVASLFDRAGITLNQCLADGENCNFSGECPVHHQLYALQLELDAKLKSITFNQLV